MIIGDSNKFGINPGEEPPEMDDKDSKYLITRRQFIKKTAGGLVATAAGLHLGGFINIGKVQAQIPSDEFRVVMMHNAAMAGALVNGWSNQNSQINSAIVSSTMDSGMLCLTQKSSLQDAWSSIFPTGTSMGSVKVGIKVNFITYNIASHTAIVDNIIKNLTSIGVALSNIYVYDERSLDALNTSLGNPGVNIGNFGRTGGYSVAGLSTSLTTILANDTVDYIINVPIVKTHWDQYARFTMSMKNHFGSFSPNHGNPSEYISGINAHEKIRGKTILVVLDALYATNGGFSGVTTAMPNKLFFGKSNIALDYVAAKYLLDAELGYNPDLSMARSWASLADHGITGTQLDNLPLITSCSGDSVPPKAPINLIVNPV